MKKFIILEKESNNNNFNLLPQKNQEEVRNYCEELITRIKDKFETGCVRIIPREKAHVISKQVINKYGFVFNLDNFKDSDWYFLWKNLFDKINEFEFSETNTFIVTRVDCPSLQELNYSSFRDEERVLSYKNEWEIQIQVIPDYKERLEISKNLLQKIHQSSVVDVKELMIGEGLSEHDIDEMLDL